LNLTLILSSAFSISSIDGEFNTLGDSIKAS
jgi:hypothetical protein